jgi:hypothetical protein
MRFPDANQYPLRAKTLSVRRKLFGDERGGLGAGIVAQPQRGELAEVDVLPEHRLVIVLPVDADVPDAALVVIVELDIGAGLVLQNLVELVVPFVQTIVRRVEAQEFDGIAGLVDDGDVAANDGAAAIARPIASSPDRKYFI